ncbi:MAG TPA: hypothetical protein VE010_05645 [Thermoanaerobaculia bacterium]|nr:hypothetical protein [Thermoanaerobaculia bacterium]
MSRTSRRQFAKSLAVAGAAAPLAVTDLLAQVPVPVAPPPAPPRAAAAPTPPSPLTRALTEVVRASYGQHLSNEELAKIGKDYDEFAPYIENFRKFKLTNADEPDFTFHSLTERW